MTLHGIDVSNHQGAIAFDAVARSGVDFLIAKATEGVGYRDTQFTVNWSEAARVGMVRGAYHFARPDLGNVPDAEADYFVENVGPLHVGDLLALDYEVDRQAVSAGVDSVWWCVSFINRVKAATGIAPLLYLNLSTIRAHDWTAAVGSGAGLWLALYDDLPDVLPTTPWPFVAMKQYTSGGAVPGVAGRVDMDVFYGGRDQLLAYGKKSGGQSMDSPQRMGQSADLVLQLSELGTLQGIYAYPAHPEGRAIVWKVRATRIGRTVITMHPPVDPDADATMLISAEPCIFVVDVLP